MMRRGMLPIIMFPDGDMRITLHLVPFWVLTIWGSVHIEETVVGWRTQLRMKTSAYITPRTSLVNEAPPMPLRASSHPGSPNSPSCSALVWYSCWPGLSPWCDSGDRTPAARTAALPLHHSANRGACFISTTNPEGKILVHALEYVPLSVYLLWLWKNRPSDNN